MDALSHPQPDAQRGPRPALPGYEAVRPIGAGGTGTVWLLRDSGTGRQCAAKLILAPSGASPDHASEALERARKEVRIAQARPHDHILPVHGALPAEVSGTPAVAILADYAPGGSLGRLLQARGRLPIGECVTVVAPIAQALAVLHADGTAHGDVSPGNILFTVEGKPLLADFGLGRMVGDAAGDGGGTPGFHAPHAAVAPAPASVRHAAEPGGAGALRPAALAAAGDVFSLGAVAWFALTGAPPARTEARPPLPLIIEDVPAELAAAIEAALREDPRQRPSAEELARSVLRSARPARVDLSSSVDASVLPELLTRRQEPAAGRGRLLGSGRRRSNVPRGAQAPGRGPRGQRGRPREGRPRTWLAWSGAGVLAVVTVLAAAWWIGSLGGTTGHVAGSGHGAARPQGSSTSDSAATADGPLGWAALPEGLRRSAESADPVQAVQALSEIRARAIAAQDRGLLSAVNAPGSAAGSTDEALLDQLAADGQRLEGFSARVLSAVLEEQSAAGGQGAAGAETAVVRARIVTSGYAVKDSTGATVGERPAGLDQELRVLLQRGAHGWKVASIAAA